MAKNPFLKMEEKVTKKVYNNTGTITYRVITQTYNSATGAITDAEVDVVCNVPYSDPHLISDYVIASSTEIVGEITLTIPYKSLQDNLTKSVGTTGHTLSYYRTQPFGISIRDDYLTILGKSYRIVKMTPMDVYANTPASVKFNLKEGK